ncbi:hypothetical protein VOLCADRAFT_91414 [Volvox carteri f. nagariensis]|uniref:Uncharacterized protein n=1 Tax=Volvox carteri f. nagariensis TaxID=3068 RepID=D8TX06_VOLCA|nr:uncharacterized protein VOLCADRAFT_91414 [Volvox carteri f. nagariensis]EFJ47827.1 hypothetical protein VOLCADRAFT_91414 [Volvox carteri f. nagariensis]|eukprot:XP_002950933.1 hypothetical protein VOLCADRAFT_91414 [Volvox carteri f. nagariensis]
MPYMPYTHFAVHVVITSFGEKVWSVRPLTRELCEYAAVDVRYLHLLAEALSPRMNRELADKVLRESARRTTATLMSNNKDLRAAAPVMIVRYQSSPSSTSSGSTSSAGGRVSNTSRPVPASGGGGGGSRYVSPRMGLMEWLTAALLLRYDRHGLTVSEPLSLRPAAQVAVAAVAAAEAEAKADSPAAVPSTLPPPQRQLLAATEVPRLHPVASIFLDGGADDPQTPTPPGAVAAVAAAAVTSTPSSPPPLLPVTSQQQQTTSASSSAAAVNPTESAVAVAAPAAAATSATPAPRGFPPMETELAADHAAVASAPPATGVLVSSLAGTIDSQLQPAAAALAAPAPAVTAPAAARSSLTDIVVDGSVMDQQQASLSFPTFPGGGAAAVAPSGAVVAMEPAAVAAAAAAAACSDRHPVMGRPATAAALSPLWLDLRTKYECVDADEEQKLARLAAVWLLLSQQGLVKQATGPGALGRRDPGLCWLLR